MKRFFIIMVVILMIISLPACGQGTTLPTATPTSLPSTTFTPQPTPTLTQTPTQTFTFAPTYTPTRTPLSTLGTGNLRQLVRFGELTLGSMVSVSPDSQIFALRTDDGIDLYRYPTLEKLRTLKQTTPRKSSSFLTALTTLAFSPDGKTLAAAAEKGTVILWELSTGNQLKTFSGLEREITSLAFWPNGQFLYATAEDASLIIWEVVSGSVLNRTTQKGRGISIAATGGLYLSFADTNGKLTLNGPNGEIVLPINGAVNNAAISPNGKMLIVAGDSTLTLWNISSREQQSALVGPACCVAFSPDSQLVVTGGKSERVVHLWDATTGRRLFSFNQPAGIQQVTFTPDGSTLLVGLMDKTVQILTLDDPNRPTITPPPTSTSRPTFTQTAIAPASLGALPVATLGSANVNQVVELARWQKAQGLFLSFIANGQAVLDASDTSIDLRNTLDGKILSSFTFQNTKSGLQNMALSPDGKLLAITADSKTSVWRISNPAARQTMTSIEKCTALAFSPDDQSLLCDMGDNVLTLVNLSTGAPQRTFSGQIKNVLTATFTSDGKTLAAAGNDGNIILWDTATGKAQRTLTGFSGWITGFQFSPDGQTLAYTTKDGLALLNTISGALFNLPDAQNPAFSPDGQLLAVTTPDGLMLWNITNHQPVYTISVAPQTALAFSSDGKLLASAQKIGSRPVRLWGIPSNQPRVTAKPATITPTRTPTTTTTLPAPLAADWSKKYGFQVTYPQPQIIMSEEAEKLFQQILATFKLTT